MIRALTNPVEAFRTAPLQLTAAAVGLGDAAVGSFVASTIEHPYTPYLYGIAAFSVAAAALNAFMAKGRFDLRDRIEAVLDRRGFDDRIMGVTTEQYCNRQATLVACENYGCPEQYAALCQSNSASAKVTWLPHI